MNLKDLSKVVLDSMDECIKLKVDLNDVEVSFISQDYAVSVNYAQLRFNDEFKHGILILDNID